MILSHIIPIKEKAGRSRKERTKRSSNFPESSAQNQFIESPVTHQWQQIQRRNHSLHKVFLFAPLVVSLFFPFKFCKLSFFLNLCDQRPVTYSIYFQVVYTGATLQVIDFHIRNRTWGNCPIRRQGSFWTFQEHLLVGLCLTFLCRYSRDGTVLENHVLAMPMGLSFPLLRRHLLLRWRHGFPSIEVRVWVRILVS